MERLRAKVNDPDLLGRFLTDDRSFIELLAVTLSLFVVARLVLI